MNAGFRSLPRYRPKDLRTPRTGYKYGRPEKSIHVKRPHIVIRRVGGHRPPKPVKPRRYTMWFNNAWQVGRYLTVKNEGYVESCEARGISVFEPRDVFTPHLPSEFSDVIKKEPEDVTSLGPILKDEDHPFFNEEPAYVWKVSTYLAKNQQFEQAKCLFKTVEIRNGLPDQLMTSSKILPDQDELVKNVIKEALMFDATQKRLPRNVAVPYIGWHPVEDRMHKKMPYDVTKISWGRRAPREYGIPNGKKNMSLMKGFLKVCDILGGEKPSLLSRNQIENSKIRQFFRHGEKLVKISLPMGHVVTDRAPLPRFADVNEVKATENIPLPDVFPLHPVSHLFPSNVYSRTMHFPIKRNHHVHTAIEHLNHHLSFFRKNEGFYSTALAQCFMTALGQARLLYGEDVADDLPAPVTINFVSTDGKRFHFSAYQLNTLNLGEPEGIKNIFWHDPNVYNLYEECGYKSAIPTLTDYNPTVFSRFASLYMWNA